MKPHLRPHRLSLDPLGATAKQNALSLSHYLLSCPSPLPLPTTKPIPTMSSTTPTTTETTTPSTPLKSWGQDTSRLDGKVALVTGSGRGIGSAIAIELARRGAKVIINYAHSSAAAQSIVDTIVSHGGEALAIQADIGNVSETIRLMDSAVEHFGQLDIVCSNSGVVSFGHLKDVTEEEYDRVMRINTRGQFFVAREAYKHLSVGGRIILMGSITGQAKGVPKHAVYSGSKGAIETFVRCMAIDCGDKKITVNCVAPGGIKTDMYHKVCKEYIPGGEKLSDDEVDEVSCFFFFLLFFGRTNIPWVLEFTFHANFFLSCKQYAKTWSPVARVGQPIDIARVVGFLASQDGEWVNGKVIGIDGAACM